MPIDSFTGEHAFLSNFYPCGTRGKTIEHAYQASKTWDEQEEQRILAAATPGQAKRLGRHCTLREDWEGAKLGVMLDLLLDKFRGAELGLKLEATGDEELIEGNTWGDTYWGVCEGKGENWLGRLLMVVRSYYRA